MESPVRICFSAAILVHLLLLSNSKVLSSAIPPPTPSESDDTTVHRSMPFSYVQVNRTTWAPRKSPIKSSTEDPFAVNDINPKTTNSREEQTKDDKPRTRGTVRYNIQSKNKPITTAIRRRVTPTTTKPDLEIVTPTPEKKNISQTIDSMKKFKTSMLPKLTPTSTTPMTELEIDATTDTDHYDSDENYDISKFTSSEFHDEDNVYTLPGFSVDDLYPQKSNTKEKTPSKIFTNKQFESYSSSKPKDFFDSYKSKAYEQFNSYNHFDNEDDLTTPQNDLFDKRFREITLSIMENLEKHKAENTKQNHTYKDNLHGMDVTKSLNVEELINRKPENNSKMFFHKSKSIVVSDNEADGSSLSDVQGTSIYFETSMLSTESYGSDLMTEVDCENDTIKEEPTPSTPPYKEEISSQLKFTEHTTSSTQASIGTNYPSRNVRVSPKKINFSPLENKDIIKDETFTHKTAELSSNHLRPVTRRIQFTSPKPRVTYRISVKRNPTTQHTKLSYPTTIYAEHFNVKDKTPSETLDKKHSILTTVSSDIDPVLETEISGTKKVVHTHTISDNSIPSLRKRGSTKFVGFSTAEPASSEDASSNYMTIPPTSSAWGALAGMRNPPSPTSPTVNATAHSIKNIDENELQKVAESTEMLFTSSTSTISNNINVDLFADKVESLNQDWKPLSSFQTYSTSTNAPTSSFTQKVNIVEITTITNELMDSKADASFVDSKEASTNVDWIPVNITKMSSLQNLSNTEATRPLNGNSTINSSTKSTLKPIKELPSNSTTPQIDDDLGITTNLPANFDIMNKTGTDISSDTTAKTIVEDATFSYIQISTISSSSDSTEFTIHEETTTNSPIETMAPESWHPVLPARKSSPGSKFIDYLSITTYRPTFFTTVETEIDTEISTDSSIYSTPTTNALPTTTMKVEESTRTRVEHSTEINVEKSTIINVEESTSYVKPELSTVFETQPENTKAALFETSTAENKTKPVVKTTTEIITTQKSEPTTDFMRTEKSIVTTGVPNEIFREISSETNKDNEVASKETTSEGDEEKFTTVHSNNQEFTTIFTTEITTEGETTIRTVSKLEDLTSNFSDDLTTQSPYGGNDMVQPSSAAGVAIAVSTIGVIALLLLIGLLLVLRRRRRRGRRCGVYAQRCTPVSLDAYSLDSVGVGRRKSNHRLRASKRSYGNPAYDDEVVISHPMQYAALANFALDSESMAAEFTEIPAGTVRADEVPQGCEDKNRFSNVLPLPETRVQLERLDNDPTTEYINANYVTGPGNIKNYYIACQAPMSNTVNDFWRMIWEQNSRVVVMLTEYMENGVEKCYEYLPPSEVTDNKRTFDNFQVILKRREHRDKYAVSSVQLKNLTTKTWREVSHLWYFWPAKGVPDDYDSVINFMSEMRSHMKISQNAKEFDEDGSDAAVTENGSSNNLSKLKTDDNSSLNGKGVHIYSPAKAEEMMRKTNGANGTLGRMKAAAELEGVRPCVVTCASGAGRTGALIALDICARALEGSGTVDVPRTVRALRSARPHALQNKIQYIFLYKVLSEYGNKLTGGVDSI